MISRYSRKEIASIWELKSKFSYYLDVELAVIKAQDQMMDMRLVTFLHQIHQVR